MSRLDIRQAQPSPAGEPSAPLPSGREPTSWGRYPSVRHAAVEHLGGLQPLPDFSRISGSVLPFGLGRSYGDSCLNEGGTLLETSGLNHFISFDQATGILRCESGVTFGDILALAVPRGWFLPTTPGTKFVTIGGAIANDVHGKNHHVAGTFGRHVTQFELLRSDGQRLVCSPQQNPEMYRATIGGMGLTGLILWAEIALRAVPGPFIDMESIRFRSLEEFFDVNEDSDGKTEYTMAWIDCLASGSQLGRGLFMRGNHAWQPRIPGKSGLPQQRLSLPVDLPGFVLNGLSLRAFNTLLYYKQIPASIRRTVPFDPFFYPLDSIGGWHRMYGKAGFLQHQCVIPTEASLVAIRSILEATSRAGEGSFLAVIKKFGDIASPGMMSFPRPGVTLALDFAFKGQSTLSLLDRLDAIVMEHGGAVYPAKDAHMSPAVFQQSFPQWQEFAKHIDPRFSSSFWRRVTQTDRSAALA